MVTPSISNSSLPAPVAETSLAPSKPVLIDAVLLEQISKAAQGIFNTAAPQLVTHTNTVVDLGILALETSAKVAINAKVAAVAPCIAPAVNVCTTCIIDLAGKEVRTALHEQVDECIKTRGPVAVDACVKGCGDSVNSVYVKACT